MTCTEFQKVLPYIIESGGSTQEEEHQRQCPVCSDLVADLKYIAEQAKLLVPMEEPSARVWEGIRDSLEREGLVKASSRFRPVATLTPRRWAMPARVAAFAALLLVAVGLLSYMRNPGRQPGTVQVGDAVPVSPPDATVAVDDDDVQLINEVAQRSPALRDTYEQNLRSVNAYIAEARRSVEQDPNSAEARDHLMLAYEQKAMLYEMALSRSVH